MLQKLARPEAVGKGGLTSRSPANRPKTKLGCAGCYLTMHQALMDGEQYQGLVARGREKARAPGSLHPAGGYGVRFAPVRGDLGIDIDGRQGIEPAPLGRPEDSPTFKVSY